MLPMLVLNSGPQVIRLPQPPQSAEITGVSPHTRLALAFSTALIRVIYVCQLP